MASVKEGFKYQGGELDLFAHARNWKQYWAQIIQPWVAGDVLEVGAGIGVNTPILQTGRVRSWLCLEPDAGLAERLRANVVDIPHCRALTGDLGAVAQNRFDSILYIDVLEHIENDREELARAADLLRAGGHVIVLSPALQFLFSDFDGAIGHFRRYNASSLRARTPSTCDLVKLSYLDSVGMAASLANKLILRRSMPALAHIQIWDRFMVPVSRLVDPFLRFAGKSIIAVWRRS